MEAKEVELSKAADDTGTDDPDAVGSTVVVVLAETEAPEMVRNTDTDDDDDDAVVGSTDSEWTLEEEETGLVV